MTERVKIWADIGYKVAVMVGSLAMVMANLKFASKDDLQLAKDEIKGSISAINTAIATTNQSISQTMDLIQRLERIEHDHESRIRAIEMRQFERVK